MNRSSQCTLAWPFKASPVYVKSAGHGQLSSRLVLVLDGIEPAGFNLLAVSGEHAARVAELPLLHKDPFDRILVAQALVEPMILLTNDGALQEYGSFVRLS